MSVIQDSENCYPDNVLKTQVELNVEGVFFLFTGRSAMPCLCPSVKDL